MLALNPTDQDSPHQAHSWYDTIQKLRLAIATTIDCADTERIGIRVTKQINIFQNTKECV